MKELEAVYNHQNYEKKWWDFWEKGDYFHAEVDPTKTPYVVLIPPPNVTDRLHMGHGLNNTIQDILIRWKRMQGFNCCWLPGTDHAGIATQMMVEQSLKEEGKTRQAIGREAFFDRCVQWKDKNGGIIIDQLKRLGSSCDWKREAYTMDEHLSKAVRKIFVDLFEAGLIYRGERLINWDPALLTAISDDEVEMEDIQGHLWLYRYPIKGFPNTFIPIATTRPETMFGDTAVAVNPDDERYKDLIGKQAIVPFVNRKVPIIADPYVKPEFGTGAVKITPAHDPNDFEMAKRHGLPFINIMNDDASMNEQVPLPFRGMDRFVARKAVVKALKEMGLMDEEKSNKHTVPFSSRGKVPIEPKLSKQWFVKMEPLAGPAINAARYGDLKFYPDAWKKTYFHWLENIQDWCISRQLWWGHRIPIWYCQDCHQVSTGMEDPTHCHHCQSANIVQDEDVLDTWFSSWLWPISPFGWPDDTKELSYFYPSQVLVTGADIIFLWVARMVMLGLHTRGEIPFKDVYFNSIICDKQGRKFSKTLGNGIDPLAVADKFGADAVRYTCVNLAPIGGRVKMTDADFENGGRFINKLWNAARFLLSKVRTDQCPDFDPDALDLPSQWMIHELYESAERMNHNLSTYHINEASENLFHLVWRSFCDWGLESAKDALEGEDQLAYNQGISVLIYVLEGILRLAAPVIPFVSEEIWSKLPEHPRWKRQESLVISEYPNQSILLSFPEASQQWGQIQDLISGIRSVRTQGNISPRDNVGIHIRAGREFTDLVCKSESWIKRLGKVSNINVGETLLRPDRCLVSVGRGFEAFIPVGEDFDFEKESLRLQGEIKRIDKIVQGIESKLSSAQFVDRAPADVVEQTRAQLANMKDQLANLQKNLDAIC